MKRIGFVCDTPLQIFNCINIACNNYSGKEYEKVIYVGMIFNNADEIVSRLKKTNIFDKVYCFRPVINVVEKSVILRGKSLLTPRSLMKKFCKDDDLNFFKFDSLFVNMLNYFTRLVMFANKYEELIEYEDGIGSYIDNTFDYSVLSPVARVLNKLYRGKLMPQTDKIYLNCADFYSSMNSRKVSQLNKLNGNNVAMRYINKIFADGENSIYLNNKVIYLSQIVDNDADTIKRVECDILSSLYAEINDVIVRCHPRNNSEKSKKYKYDDKKTLWELECCKSIDDDCFLISMCSTASFMPTMLTGSKPYVVFTYELFQGFFSDKFKENFSCLVNRLKEYYAEESYKILMAKNVEEIIEFIKKYNKNFKKGKE